MRVAPCAVMDDPFLRACEAAAITHDHPTGYLCAGAFAQILACLMLGDSLEQGIEQACARLVTFAGHEETIQAINAAVELAATNPGDAAMVETLGGGWVGEETLAIALYCALSHPDDFEKALLLSVNHSGDSDSTGAVCGNLMGMKLGAGVWPEKWKKYLELNELIGDMGRKLAALVKQVDDDMLYYDLKVLLNDAPQGPAPVMQTAFSYQVLPFAQVEREYLELFEALMSEVHGA